MVPVIFLQVSILLLGEARNSRDNVLGLPNGLVQRYNGPGEYKPQRRRFAILQCLDHLKESSVPDQSKPWSYIPLRDGCLPKELVQTRSDVVPDLESA